MGCARYFIMCFIPCAASSVKSHLYPESSTPNAYTEPLPTENNFPNVLDPSEST